ncbi:hypothetical protein LJB80_00185 [Bacteroides sp. OttesenSCG-928-F21]|nr:hypothetical protein [Bacteroides sp. OttesenSCG-928-F21]
MNLTLKQFCVRFGITKAQFFGEEEMEKDLYLGDITSIPDGFNPKTTHSLFMDKVTSIPEGFKPIVGDSLFLNRLETIPNGFCPVVGNSLYLNNVTSIPPDFNPNVKGLCLNSLQYLPKGFNPTVTGSLCFGALTSIPEGFNPTAGELILYNVTELPENFMPTISGDLDLCELKVIPRGFKPIVGRELFLPNVVSIPENMEIKTGGDLYLSSLKTIPKGLKLIVGGDLFLNSLESIPPDFKPIIGGTLVLNEHGIPQAQAWRNGKYMRVDGITVEVISHEGNIYKIKKLNEASEFTMVTDGNNKWAYAETLDEAKENLMYKVGNWDYARYENLSMDSVVSYETAIDACMAITFNFERSLRENYRKLFEKIFKERKRTYKISEFIEMAEETISMSTFKWFIKKETKK